MLVSAVGKNVIATVSGDIDQSKTVTNVTTVVLRTAGRVITKEERNVLVDKIIGGITKIISTVKNSGLATNVKDRQLLDLLAAKIKSRLEILKNGQVCLSKELINKIKDAIELAVQEVKGKAGTVQLSHKIIDFVRCLIQDAIDQYKLMMEVKEHFPETIHQLP